MASVNRQFGVLVAVVLVFGPVLAVVLTSTSSSASSSVTASRPADTVAACTDLVLDYALYRDQGDVEKYAGLFAEDAVLTVQGQRFSGRDSIRQRLLDAKGGPKTRHLMSTIRIVPKGTDRATGISYVTVYSAEGPEGAVLPVAGFAIIGNYVDEFVRTAEGWRIDSRTLEGAFSFQSESWGNRRVK